MILLPEAGSKFYNKEGMPPITVSDEVVTVAAEDIAEQYIRAQAAIEKFFGIPLLASSIKAIEIEGDADDSDEDTASLLGEFTKYKTLRLYVNRIRLEPNRNWREVFSHEIGHGFHNQVWGDFSIYQTQEVFCEAMAEMMEPIVREGGDFNSVARRLRRSMMTSDRLLFGPPTTWEDYPDLVDKRKDAAQLFYLVNRYGLDTVLNLGSQEPLFLEKASTASLREEVGGEDSKYNHHLLNKLDSSMAATFGINRIQLFEDARDWFGRL